MSELKISNKLDIPSEIDNCFILPIELYVHILILADDVNYFDVHRNSLRESSWSTGFMLK